MKIVGFLLLTPFIIYGVLVLTYFLTHDPIAVLVALMITAWAYAGLRLIDN